MEKDWWRKTGGKRLVEKVTTTLNSRALGMDSYLYRHMYGLYRPSHPSQGHPAAAVGYKPRDEQRARHGYQDKASDPAGTPPLMTASPRPSCGGGAGCTGRMGAGGARRTEPCDHRGDVCRRHDVGLREEGGGGEDQRGAQCSWAPEFLGIAGDDNGEGGSCGAMDQEHAHPVTWGVAKEPWEAAGPPGRAPSASTSPPRAGQQEPSSTTAVRLPGAKNTNKKRGSSGGHCAGAGGGGKSRGALCESKDWAAGGSQGTERGGRPHPPVVPPPRPSQGKDGAVSGRGRRRGQPAAYGAGPVRAFPASVHLAADPPEGKGWGGCGGSRRVVVSRTG